MHCIEVSDHLLYHTSSISAFKVEFRALTNGIRVALSIARVKTRGNREGIASETRGLGLSLYHSPLGNCSVFTVCLGIT